MMKLRINPLVVADLKDIRDYIAEDNAEKARETIKKIYSVFEKLQIFPGVGTELSKRVSFSTDYLYLAWRDYIILYKIRDDFIEIFRVISRYQDITRIFIEL